MKGCILPVNKHFVTNPNLNLTTVKLSQEMYTKKQIFFNVNLTCQTYKGKVRSGLSKKQSNKDGMLKRVNFIRKMETSKATGKMQPFIRKEWKTWKAGFVK
jgi:hypothetical protein